MYTCLPVTKERVFFPLCPQKVKRVLSITQRQFESQTDCKLIQRGLATRARLHGATRERPEFQSRAMCFSNGPLKKLAKGPSPSISRVVHQHVNQRMSANTRTGAIPRYRQPVAEGMKQAL